MKNHEGNVELQKKVHRIYIYSYIFNQNIYRAKWFTFMESEIIGNVELFCTKKIPVFYTKLYGWYALW